MAVERLAYEPGLAARLRAAGGAAVEAPVRAVIERVRAEGDAAVAAYTREWDTGGAPPRPFRVRPEELQAAGAALPAPLRAALELAAANVRVVAEAGLGGERRIELPQGQTVTQREIPVGRAAVYVPGGRAPYPSTVVMGAVTAQAAGVEQVVVCSPPSAGGDVDPLVLAACHLCGVGEVYRMGGAQAVAALALGTPSVPRVDVIAGPGNVYVQEAKRQLSGVVGVDSFAGPSELLVVVDDESVAGRAALDMLAQAEHGPGSLAAAVSPSAAALDALQRRLEPAVGSGRLPLVEVAGPSEALAFAEELAPEHLQLMGAQAEALAPRVRRAGCVFVGAGSGTAFGDYVAGSNHVLPTGGAARFASALSARTFRRQVSEVRVPPSEELARAGAAIARAEGFELHAESMEERIGENGAHG